jgi:spermidine synthase
VSHVVLERGAGGRRLYLGGDLQFDERDERLYHEPLGFWPVALASTRVAGRGLRVLILGGGDGLALRETLRSPAVAAVHLVDRDPEVLRLGAGPLADLNRGAFRDPRVRVEIVDARAVLDRARGFDVAIFDLTYPADPAGAVLLGVATFRRLRSALSPAGIAAVNAVSPELTPEAFGSIGAALGAAGLPAVPYAFELPSFRDEGYGRWGFLFASPRPLRHAELARPGLRAGATLAAGALLAGARLPAGAARAMRVAPNRRDELLYHLFNAAPLDWAPPFRLLRFPAGRVRPGPRLTAAEGFARWLRAPAGRRTLETLLGCLPLSRRGQTREALYEWSHHAEVLFREVDLRAFVEHVLGRAAALPPSWRRELHALRARLRADAPPLGDLLTQAFRVFAVYLLLLLVTNLFFPDNVYAKGWSSSSSRSTVSSGSSSSEPFTGFAFSDPGVRFAPYRYRALAYAGRGTGRAGAVPDPEGREGGAPPVALAAAGGAPPPTSVVALTARLQLLDSGALVYVVGVPGFDFLLEPGRLRALDAGGRDVQALLPDAALETEARQQLDAQAALIARALADHRRWLDWVAYARATAPGRQAGEELAALERVQEAVARARAAWHAAAPTLAPASQPGWVPVFPGVYLERRLPQQGGPAVVLVEPGGTLRTRTLASPAVLGADDRLLFQLLWRRQNAEPDPILGAALAPWLAAHGEALGPARTGPRP